MGDAFTMPAKTAGKCVICNKEYAQGDTVHLQNIGTEETKVWIGSPHEECFKKIQADPSLMKKSKSGFPPKPQRTPQQRFDDVKIMLDKIIDLSIAHANKIILPPTAPASMANSATVPTVSKPEYDAYLKRWDICWQVIFKGAVEEYTR